MCDSFTTELLNNSWERSWNKIFIVPNYDLRDNLIWRYSEPSRKYHNISHLIGSIINLQHFKHLSYYPEMVELAIWFHDAIYDPKRNDNEAQSINLWYNSFRLPDGFKYKFFDTYDKISPYVFITDLIDATDLKLTRALSNTNQFLIRDIDLITLGADEDIFKNYCRKIRNEYWFVNDEVYWKERYKILNKIYDQPSIYHWKEIGNIFENKAKSNLRKELYRISSWYKNNFDISL